MFTSCVLLGLLALARADDVLLTLTGVEATYYYDIDENYGIDVCAASGAQAADWAITSGINSGVTYCQDSGSAYTLDDLDTNRIVAMNHTMIAENPTLWCGKEVEVFDADGNQIVLDEGPFVLYDACAAAVTSKIVDFSAKAFTQISGGTCGNNPTGLTIKVLDTTVSASGNVSADSASVTAGSDTATTAAAPTTAAATTAAPTTTAPTVSIGGQVLDVDGSSSSSSYSIRGSSAWWSATSSSTAAAAATTGPGDVDVGLDSGAFATSSDDDDDNNDDDDDDDDNNNNNDTDDDAHDSDDEDDKSTATATATGTASASTATTSSCTYGAWRCSGLELQVCSYQSTTDIDWEMIEACESSCSITDSGSVDCY
ncbi:hypothetical protein Q5752_003825 [Cryptotrichosporon argae]